MNIVYLYFINFITFSYAECCEVQEWSPWGDCSATCGSSSQQRMRICSTYDGWKLGLACNMDDAKKEEAKKYETQFCQTEACRKLLIFIYPKTLRDLTVLSLFFKLIGQNGLIGQLVVPAVVTRECNWV